MGFFNYYKLGTFSTLCLIFFGITSQLQHIWFVTDTRADTKAMMFIDQITNNDNYLDEMDILNKQKVDMDDPRLIRLIRNYWIENPSDQPYNLKQPHVMDPSIGQAAFVDNRLNFKVSVLMFMFKQSPLIMDDHWFFPGKRIVGKMNILA